MFCYYPECLLVAAFRNFVRLKLSGNFSYFLPIEKGVAIACFE